ncbi:hypothetical protein AGRA3207_000785 [Actinomadura graeca]|uniref:Uncharacterized protein n=1 Tax=Actinomadura graeca TaxID=2750812 RepID=A0ABX8QND3_9ACTN|nr:hypothetical protein [Actinomadura graeca]QXJ20131.1 hypothetical protein AGRA3207_000785 [Actinomadura graeca]
MGAREAADVLDLPAATVRRWAAREHLRVFAPGGEGLSARTVKYAEADVRALKVFLSAVRAANGGRRPGVLDVERFHVPFQMYAPMRVHDDDTPCDDHEVLIRAVAMVMTAYGEALDEAGLPRDRYLKVTTSALSIMQRLLRTLENGPVRSSGE